MLGATGDGGYQDCSFGEMRPAQSQKNIEEDEQNDDNPFFGGKIVPM